MTGAVPTISDREIRADPSALGARWRAAPSFVVLPDKGGVSEAWLAQLWADLPEPMQTGHFALLTSGSTGEPKLVVGARARAEALVRTLHEVQESEPVREAIVALPLSYSYAFVNQWLWSHVHERRLVVTGGLGDAAGFGEALAAARDAMLCLVGAQVPMLLQHFQGRRFDGVVRLHFAGGRFPQERLDELAALFPAARVFNNYGCAEAMPRLTIRRAADASEATHIGRPIPGVELRTDADDRLLFRSPYRAVALGVAGHIAPVDDTEWLPTGDLAREVADGWALLGRGGEVFKRFGEKVSLPTLLARVLELWTGSAAFYVEPSAGGDPGHVLAIAPDPTPEQVTALLQQFRRHFTRPHWPVRIEAHAALPLLPNGKPDLQRLAAERDAARVVWRQPYAPAAR